MLGVHAGSPSTSTLSLASSSSFGLPLIPSLDLLRPCFDTFWSDVHGLVPAIHRKTLLEALAGSRTLASELYGNNTPSALMFAIAACGARSVYAPELSSVARARLVRDYCEQARSLVLSGYVGRSKGDPQRMSLLEAAQTLFLIFEVVWTLGDVQETANTSADSINAEIILVRKLCFETDATTGKSVFSARRRTPQTPSEWILDESKIRIFLIVASMEQARWHWAAREPILLCGDSEIPLPCSDALFNHYDPTMAFWTLCGEDRNLSSNLASVDFAAFRADPTIEKGSLIAAACLQPVIEGCPPFCSLPFYVVCVVICGGLQRSMGSTDLRLPLPSAIQQLRLMRPAQKQ
jgi:hypothetical protein